MENNKYKKYNLANLDKTNCYYLQQSSTSSSSYWVIFYFPNTCIIYIRVPLHLPRLAIDLIKENEVIEILCWIKSKPSDYRLIFRIQQRLHIQSIKLFIVNVTS